MRSRSSRWWPLAGLGALIVLNVVLIAVLVLRPATPPADDQSTDLRQSPTTTQEAEEDTEPVKESPADIAAGDDDRRDLRPTERLLVNADASTAWRASVGSCDVPGVLERSDDGGVSWQELPFELAPVSRLRALSSQSLFAIGGGEDCEPTYVSSLNAGEVWSTNDQYLEGSWYLLPADTGVMAAPVGQTDTPCDAVGLAGLDATNAAVLCADGALELTTDAGVTWDGATPLVEPFAIGVADDGYVLAGTHEKCDEGVAVAAMEVSGDASETSCLDIEAPTSESVAISATSGVVWLWAGDETALSDDAL